jgi:hypothetical protein
MRRTYLATCACAIFVLLGGCGTSSDKATDANLPPKGNDSGVPGTGIDSSPVATDTGTPSTGLDTQGQVRLDGAFVGPDSAAGTGLDGGIDSGLAIDGNVDTAADLGRDTKADATNLVPDVPANADLDSQGSSDVNNANLDVAVDVSVEVGKPTYDGGLGLSCIKGLFGTYVMRWDGILIDETSTASPQTVFDASTGLPLDGAVNMQQGTYHGCAVLSTGAVSCWQSNAGGGNMYGQLGNGTTTAATALYRATPVLTGPGTPLANVVALAPGVTTNSSCAVTSDKKLWCWGILTWLVNKGIYLAPGYAQAITTDGAAPLTGVVSAALATNDACAIVSGSPNAVWCWGENSSGQSGQGDTKARQYPTKVVGLSNPIKVAVVDSATVCVLEGEGVKCWGRNYEGQAGANVTTGVILSPTSVVVESGAALDAVTDLQAGNASFSVLRSSGTMWTWGTGYHQYAANYGQTNVLAIGWATPPNSGPRFLTSDGLYHNGANSVAVNCNAL